jgi:response regulator RpfG family c-di-GMP phosphodiesterase
VSQVREDRVRERRTALAVESDRATRELLVTMLQHQGYDVSQAATVAEACSQFEVRRYDVVLAAAGLPDGSGSMVAEVARQREAKAATVIIGAYGDGNTAHEVLSSGVDGYLIKPLNSEQLAVTVAAALRRRGEREASRERGEELRELVEAQSASARDPAFGQLLLRRLARACRLHDEETTAHMQRMSESCAAIARELGLPNDDCERLQAAAPVHDIGKVGVPDAVLFKRGELTDDERRLIQRHTEYGYDILSGSGDDLVELAATIALNHHERPDGKGYPRGLSAEEIPLPARIAAVADVFDALTHDRVHRSAYTVEEAVRMMVAGRGTQFDAKVFDAFNRVLNEIAQLHKRLPDAPLEGQESTLVNTDSTDPARALIVEDHEAVGRGLELLLRREGLEVAGTAANLVTARRLLERRKPHVVVLDVELGSENGLDLVEEAQQSGAKVLLYTGRADPQLLAAASRSRVLGVATKAASPVELVAAVRAVAKGEEYRDPRLTPTELRAHSRPRLTPREREVVTLLAQGLNGEEIAETLFIAPETVRTHLRNAMNGVGARTRAHLIAVAIAGDEIAVEA